MPATWSLLATEGVLTATGAGCSATIALRDARGFFVTTMLWIEVLSLRLLLLPQAAFDGVGRR